MNLLPQQHLIGWIAHRRAGWKIPATDLHETSNQVGCLPTAALRLHVSLEPQRSAESNQLETDATSFTRCDPDTRSLIRELTGCRLVCMSKSVAVGALKFHPALSFVFALTQIGPATPLTTKYEQNCSLTGPHRLVLASEAQLRGPTAFARSRPWQDNTQKTASLLHFLPKIMCLAHTNCQTSGSFTHMAATKMGT